MLSVSLNIGHRAKAKANTMRISHIAIVRYNSDNEDYVTIGPHSQLDWSVQREQDRFWICLTPTRNYYTTEIAETLSYPMSLREVREQFDTVTERNLTSACSRIVHLSRCLGRRDPKLIVGLEELRDELQRLVVSATVMQIERHYN